MGFFGPYFLLTNKTHTFFLFGKRGSIPPVNSQSKLRENNTEDEVQRDQGYSMNIITYVGGNSFSHHQFSDQFSPGKALRRHAEEHISNVC